MWSALIGKPSNSLLDSIKKKSVLNEILSNDFAYQKRDYELRNYYETRKTDVEFRKWKVLPQILSMVCHAFSIY